MNIRNGSPVFFPFSDTSGSDHWKNIHRTYFALQAGRMNHTVCPGSPALIMALNGKITRILSLLLALHALSCTSERTGGQSIQPWEYLTRDGRWSGISVPFTVRNPAEPGTVAWYRLRADITVNENSDRFHGISLGRVLHLDRVFLNGRLLGDTLPSEWKMYGTRQYLIPAGLLKRGSNTLEVRLGIFPGEFGGLCDETVLLTREGFRETMRYHMTLFNDLPSGIMFFYAGVAILSLLFFSLNRRERIFLYSGIILIIHAAYILMIFFPPAPHHLTPFYYSLLWAAIPLLAMLFMLSIQSFYGFIHSGFRTVLAALGLLSAAIILLPFAGVHAGRELGTLSFCIIVPSYPYLLYRLHRLNPERGRFLALAAIIGGATAITLCELYMYFNGIPLIFLPTVYGSPLLVISFMILVGRGYMNKWLELNLLYGALREPGEPFAEDPGREPSAPGAAVRGRLDRVIAFLEENYTSDISREGLAAVIGVNPDHLSRIFNAHTGMRINEYINELRIKETGRLLLESDLQIIDIAYRVGFESLSTFNRAFQKRRGMSPRDFRAGKAG